MMYRFLIFLLVLAFVATGQTYSANRTTRSILKVPPQWVSNRNVYASELIRGGHEDSLALYVARAYQSGDWIPGKAVVFDGIFRAYVPWWGKEYEHRNFEVLVSQLGVVSWVHGIRNNFHPNAIIGGHDPKSKENTYICRASHDGKLIIGKALQTLEICFIPYFGKEIRLKNFEILIENQSVVDQNPVSVHVSVVVKVSITITLFSLSILCILFLSRGRAGCIKIELN